MKSHKKMLAIVLAVCAAIAIVTAATASADHHGGDDGHGHHDGSVTGFPKTIATVDLNGYKIVTDYSLGVNTGNTFEQDYTDTGVTAFAIAGPGVGGGNYVAHVHGDAGRSRRAVRHLVPTRWLESGRVPDELQDRNRV